jgi:NADP-dependent 3-hydroxy acid dehydrogenase YdfG
VSEPRAIAISLFDRSGEVALATEGGSGFGRSFSQALVANGPKVSGVGRHLKRVNAHPDKTREIVHDGGWRAA